MTRLARTKEFMPQFMNDYKGNCPPVKDFPLHRLAGTPGQPKSKSEKERLRPMLMMTLAMVFGMLPIALVSGASAEIKNGMAWVIIGGLTSSMLLTLFLVPSIYLVVDRIIERVMGRRAEPKAPQELEVAKEMV